MLYIHLEGKFGRASSVSYVILGGFRLMIRGLLSLGDNGGSVGVLD
jgi:hypothetical protein